MYNEYANNYIPMQSVVESSKSELEGERMCEDFRKQVEEVRLQAESRKRVQTAKVKVNK